MLYEERTRFVQRHNCGIEHWSRSVSIVVVSQLEGASQLQQHARHSSLLRPKQVLLIAVYSDSGNGDKSSSGNGG